LALLKNLVLLAVRVVPVVVRVVQLAICLSELPVRDVLVQSLHRMFDL
jgi:hypothetical protein